MRHHLLVSVLALAAAAPAAGQTVEIKEWPVEWKGHPRDPYVDAQNRVWFVGQQGNYIGYFDPAKEEFKQYSIPDGTYPHNLIVAKDGSVWFAGNRDGYIGKLNPETGQVQRFDMPDPAAGDPHTLVFNRAGDIWFTVQGGGFIGKLTTSTGKVDLIKVPGERTRPYGIWLDSQDRPWVNLFGTNRIAMVDPATMTLKETTLPRAEARTRRIAVTPDDMVWYVDYAAGYLGRLDPKTGEVKEWQAPSAAQSRPYAMGIDGQGRIWFVETGVQPNQFVGFDPKTEKFVGITPVPSGAGAVRHMYWHAPSSSFWFGTDTDNIGRATIR